MRVYSSGPASPFNSGSSCHLLNHFLIHFHRNRYCSSFYIVCCLCRWRICESWFLIFLSLSTSDYCYAFVISGHFLHQYHSSLSLCFHSAISSYLTLKQSLPLCLSNRMNLDFHLAFPRWSYQCLPPFLLTSSFLFI